MDAKNGFYEQAAIWDQDAEVYQRETLRDILTLLPEDARTILDAGCGDGFITNRLPEDREVMGLDISAEALSRVKRATRQGSLLDLPFGDASFDLVMCNDVLEHLNPEEAAKAVAELARAAAKYVLLTTPLWEDLEKGEVTCAACGERYHVNRHLRSFSPADHLALFADTDLRCRVQVLTGDISEHVLPDPAFLTTPRKYALGHLPYLRCPRCGSERVLPLDAPISWEDCATLTARLVRQKNVRIAHLRTECVSLFSRREPPVLPEGFYSGTFTPESVRTRELPTNIIDFEQASVFRENDLRIPLGPPYFINPSPSSDPRRLPQGSDVMLCAFMPTGDDGENLLEMRGKAAARACLTVAQFVGDAYQAIAALTVEPGEFCCAVPANVWAVTRYGCLFSLHADQELEVHTVRLGESGERFVVHSWENTVRYRRLPGDDNVLLSLARYGGTLIEEPWMRARELVAMPDALSPSATSLFLIQALQHMVNVLEENAQKSKLRISGLEQLFAKATQRIETWEQQAAQARRKIDALEQQDQDSQCRVGSLERQGQDSQRRVASLEQQGQDFQRRIDALVQQALDSQRRVSDLEQRASDQQRIIVLLEQLTHLLDERTVPFGRRCRAACKTLLERLAVCRSYALKRRYWAYCAQLKALAEAPALDGEWAARTSGRKSWLMICHDQNIDRRIIQEARTLQEHGRPGILVALSHDDDDHLDIVDGVHVHRIGLRHAVPDCKAYRRSLYFLHLLGKLPCQRALRTPKRVAFLGVYVLLRLFHYHRKNGTPLPFDFCFYEAAKHYRASMVQAHDLPALKAAATLAAEWGVPLVYDAHEFYPEQYVFSKKQKAFMDKVERTYIPACAASFCVNRELAGCMAERYGVPRPVELFNAIDPPEGLDRSADLLRRHFALPADAVICLYQGGLSPGRNLDILAKAMAKVKNPRIVLVFMGNGSMLGPLSRIVRRHHLGNRVFFKEAVPQEELLRWTCTADVGIIPYSAVDLNTANCNPNKMFEFIQAELPILANDLPSLRRFVGETGFGMVADITRPVLAAAALDAFAGSSERLAAARAALAAKKRLYSWREQSQVYWDVIDRLDCTAVRSAES